MATSVVLRQFFVYKQSPKTICQSILFFSSFLGGFYCLHGWHLPSFSAAVEIPWCIICSLHWEIEMSLTIIILAAVKQLRAHKIKVVSQRRQKREYLPWKAKTPNLVTKNSKKTLVILYGHLSSYVCACYRFL